MAQLSTGTATEVPEGDNRAMAEVQAEALSAEHDRKVARLPPTCLPPWHVRQVAYLPAAEMSKGHRGAMAQLSQGASQAMRQGICRPLAEVSADRQAKVSVRFERCVAEM